MGAPALSIWSDGRLARPAGRGRPALHHNQRPLHARFYFPAVTFLSAAWPRNCRLIWLWNDFSASGYRVPLGFRLSGRKQPEFETSFAAALFLQMPRTRLQQIIERYKT
jgi:hypothetical protein